jgi:hypothetical protein
MDIDAILCSLHHNLQQRTVMIQLMLEYQKLLAFQSNQSINPTFFPFFSFRGKKKIKLYFLSGAKKYNNLFYFFFYTFYPRIEVIIKKK